MEDILQIRNLKKSFGELRAVDGPSFDIKRGAVTGLIGPNGSGKSTLFNLISGIEFKDHGEVFFDGKSLEGLSADQIFHLGLVRSFQDPRLFFGMTVLDNAMIPPKNQIGERLLNAPFHHRWAKQEIAIANTIAEGLERIGLTELYNNPATNLSGGQTKLLEISRTLVSEPKLLLLDEPTAGVAPIMARRIFENITSLRKNRGITFLIVEHRLDVLFDFVDDVYVMDQGRILTHGTPDKVMTDAKVIDAYLGR